MYDPARDKGTAVDDVEPAAAGTDFQRLHGEWRKTDEAVAEMDFADTFDVGGEAFSHSASGRLRWSRSTGRR